MTRVHRWYSPVLAEAMGDMVERAGNMEHIGSREREVQKIRGMLVEKFDKRGDFGLYTVKYNCLLT